GRALRGGPAGLPAALLGRGRRPAGRLPDEPQDPPEHAPRCEPVDHGRGDRRDGHADAEHLTPRDPVMSETSPAFGRAWVFPGGSSDHRMNLLRSSRWMIGPSLSRTNFPSTVTRLSARSGPS